MKLHETEDLDLNLIVGVDRIVFSQGPGDWSCMIHTLHDGRREFTGATPREAFDRCLKAIRDNEPIGGKP